MMKTMKQKHERCKTPGIDSGTGGDDGDANNLDVYVENAAEALSLMAETFLGLKNRGGGTRGGGGGGGKEIAITSGRNSSSSNNNTMIKWNGNNNRSSVMTKSDLFVPSDFGDDDCYCNDNGGNSIKDGFQNNPATATAATADARNAGHEWQQRQRALGQEQTLSMKKERSTTDDTSQNLEPYNSGRKSSSAKSVKQKQQEQQLVQPPSSSASKDHYVSRMDTIITSPYEENSNAEVEEELFDRVKKMLEPYNEPAGSNSSRRSTRARGVKASPEAQKYFTVPDNGNVGDGGGGSTSIASKVVETSISIHRNDPFFYIRGWQDGSIGDKQIGKIPPQFLLICLKEWRIGTSNKNGIGQVLKRLIKELDLFEQFTEAINTWLSAWGLDISKKYRILRRLKIDMFKDGDSDCLKCVFFILRAWTCFKILQLDKGQEQYPLDDSLKSKILSCLAILKRTYKQKIKGNNSSSSNKKSKKQQQQPATMGQAATMKVENDKSLNGDHWKDVKVGSRIRMYWELDERYYRGYVSGHKKGTSEFHIKYDDGDEEWRDLKDEVFKIGSPSPPASSTAEIVTGTDNRRDPAHQSNKESQSDPMAATLTVGNQNNSILSSKRKQNPVYRNIAGVPGIEDCENVRTFAALIIDRNGDQKAIASDEPEKMVVQYFCKISCMGGGNGTFMPYSQFSKELSTIKEYVAIASAAHGSDPVIVLRYMSLAYQKAEDVVEKLKRDENELISLSNKRQKTADGWNDSVIV